MEYINYIKAKAHISTAVKSEQPVLTKEDEEFLTHVATEDQPPPLPVRAYRAHGGDAQIALLDGAQNVPLPPDTPNEEKAALTDEPVTLFPGQESIATQDQKPKRSTWSWLRRDSRDAKKQTASDLHDLAQGIKPPDAKPNEDDQVSDDEAKKEEEDMTVVLETLNLAAVNNRVFSISDETQELLVKFNQVFKDLVKGVPTAYDDLESLLTNGDRQLQKTYNTLPAFLQKLIEKLPETVTKGLGPEMLAVAAERATKAGINVEHAGKAAGIASKIMKPPSLKDLVGKPGAIAGMLRSTIAFLRARFPAFIGMNVLWSLALFVLLFVFWYCYKRGKETRQEKELELTEQEVQRLEAEYRAQSLNEVSTKTESGSRADNIAGTSGENQTTRATKDAPINAADSSAVDYKPSTAAHTRKFSSS